MHSTHNVVIFGSKKAGKNSYLSALQGNSFTDKITLDKTHNRTEIDIVTGHDSDATCNIFCDRRNYEDETNHVKPDFDADCGIIFYDNACIQRHSTSWFIEMFKHIYGDIPFVLIFNKSELIPNVVDIDKVIMMLGKTFPAYYISVKFPMFMNRINALEEPLIKLLKLCEEYKIKKTEELETIKVVEETKIANISTSDDTVTKIMKIINELETMFPHHERREFERFFAQVYKKHNTCEDMAIVKTPVVEQILKVYDYLIDMDDKNKIIASIMCNELRHAIDNFVTPIFIKQSHDILRLSLGQKLIGSPCIMKLFAYKANYQELLEECRCAKISYELMSNGVTRLYSKTMIYDVCVLDSEYVHVPHTENNDTIVSYNYGKIEFNADKLKKLLTSI
jgi:hypothetical protein